MGLANECGKYYDFVKKELLLQIHSWDILNIIQTA